MGKFKDTYVSYEKIVGEIYQDLLNKEGIETIVRHNVKDVRSKSGTRHQLDLYWCYKIAGIEHRVIVECKNHDKNISKIHVANLHSIMMDINATSGVIVTTVGFQSGAVTLAKSLGIELKLVNNPKEIDWDGYLRRTILNMYFFQREIVDFRMEYDSKSYHNPELLKKLRDDGQLNMKISSSDMVLYNQNGDRHHQKLEDVLKTSLPLDNAFSNGETYEHSLSPRDIFAKLTTFDGREFLLRISKITIYYKTIQAHSSVEIDPVEILKAGLQDYFTHEIENVLLK